MKIIFIIFSLLLVLTSCGGKVTPPKPEELYKLYNKSVVLIRNDYYFEIELDNGKKAYFTNLDKGSLLNLTFEKEDIIDKVNTIYGTGFFVSKNGLIATNKHVACPHIDEAEVLNILKLKLEEKVHVVETNIANNKRQIADIDNILYYYYNQLSYADINKLNYKRSELDVERILWTEISTELKFNQNNSKVRCISQQLSIAYNDTYVTKKEDFKECVLKSKSEDENIDLALIQLKDKMTPSFIERIFDFNNHNPNIQDDKHIDLDKPLSIDTKVYMIGFNYGVEVATTEDGLKSQLTQGTVSQESGKNRVLYSIPSLEGSSGSPIIDEWGNLVAINFAKISGTQNFNYGIISKHLKTLIEK